MHTQSYHVRKMHLVHIVKKRLQILLSDLSENISTAITCICYNSCSDQNDPGIARKDPENSSKSLPRSTFHC